ENCFSFTFTGYGFSYYYSRRLDLERLLLQYGFYYENTGCPTSGCYARFPRRSAKPGAMECAFRGLYLMCVAIITNVFCSSKILCGRAYYGISQRLGSNLHKTV